jgi:hypothetical protein
MKLERTFILVSWIGELVRVGTVLYSKVELEIDIIIIYYYQDDNSPIDLCMAIFI